MTKGIKKVENNEVIATLKANNTEYIGKGETIAEALTCITVKLIYTGGTLDIKAGDKTFHEVIHTMQMKRFFGINKTSVRLHAKQIENKLK